MTDDIQDLERDIEATRARLDNTMVRLQDRLSVSGVLDDMLGNARHNRRLGGVYDDALDAVRRNPVPVALIAVGIGLLIARLAAQAENRRHPERARLYGPARAPADRATVAPVPASRVYDPDLSPRHPSHDALESRRDLAARA